MMASLVVADHRLHDREWPVRVFEANEVVQQLSLVGWVLLRRGVNCGEVQQAFVVEAGVVLPLVRLSPLPSHPLGLGLALLVV